MSSNREAPPSGTDIKRKAWLTVFIVSTLFWCVIGLLAWHFWG
ncbi:YmiA family putative membrane protein [Apirhabdus apintestini]|nr:YmiA family putative membrane protein [Erwinia sp. HR93]MEA1064918.1 YmiA family putative membrane protein [Erwinia sp. HR93]WPM86047.1 YmiA family putative membrane protein [Enterobacteriaceae bacterium CA-0114]